MRFTTATVAIAALLSAASIVAVATDSSASVRAIRRRRRVNSSKALKLNAQAQDVFQNSAVAEGKDEVAEAAAMKMKKKKGKGGYEVWGADQSNSVAGETSAGVKGSFLWIWDSESIADQLAGGADATPLSCTPNDAVGPCDLLDIFPQ
eukprot:scaffold15160_cov119-Skeletonema_dohrnii-CCMP3373.AAC.2